MILDSHVDSGFSSLTATPDRSVLRIFLSKYVSDELKPGTHGILYLSWARGDDLLQIRAPTKRWISGGVEILVNNHRSIARIWNVCDSESVWLENRKSGSVDENPNFLRIRSQLKVCIPMSPGFGIKLESWEHSPQKLGMAVEKTAVEAGGLLPF